MEANSETKSKSDEMEQGVSRTQSQDPLDSSSTSSLSVFIDHNEIHNELPRTPEIVTDSPKEDYADRASMDEALKSEKAFIEYVMSFPTKESWEHHRSIDSMSTKSKSPTACGTTTKVGLDHLDNLCKLMEQLSELRDTNYKLHRRVQYLEDLKSLHDMHKEITESGQTCSDFVKPSKSGPYELQKSATETHVGKKEETAFSHRSPSKYLSRRSRHQNPVVGVRRERSKSVGHEDLGEDTKSKRIFPKWSKVKEAFGWESERKDSGKTKEDRHLLQAPRRRSDEARQILRHPGSPTWYHDIASIHSSLEDIHDDFDDNRWKRASVASDKYITLDIPSDGLRRQKSTPSPGSDKSHSNAEMKIKCATIERDSYRSQDLSKFDKDDGKRGKGPWGRVKTIIEKRRDSLKRRSLRRDYSLADFEPSSNKGPLSFSEAIDLKNYNEFVESSIRQSVTEDAIKKKRNKPGPIIFDQEVDYVCPRTPSSSPTFHRKSTWTKMKKALKGKKDDDRDLMSLSTPASPDSQHDGNFTFDEIDEMTNDADHDRPEMNRVGSEGYVHQLSPVSPSSDLMLQLQQNLSEDFHKKIQEWERMRSVGALSCSPQFDHKQSSDAARNRKKSERDDSKNIKPKIKDLAWLEKELQKIEKEKQRLSKERQKYEERALRLEKLRETVLTANNSNKREVLVKTAAGEFRFEGISDAFTKKLYEWETKRGLGPELSTIALLDSSHLVAQPSMTQKNGHLQRVLSRSESSIADMGQPSHNSSNSLPSVKLADGLEIDRANHSSRANSEPDLSTLVALKNGASISLSNSIRCHEVPADDEAANTAEKSDPDNDTEKKRKESETYYSLLEENVILLEQLKDKEEICRRLEKELEILDEKVDVMNTHHIQETEHYRAKLWEMHRQGTTPRDMITCRQTMDQLKMRIDTLERCTEKLRYERETVEDSFRYHSKEQETMTLDLLGKMRELKAAGASKTGNDLETKQSTYLETSTIERLQELSALLMKQTRDLETTLSSKTRQICQLKWELLHRDLSTVKLQTELHSHMAHKKRSKYAHWRSRSSEEASTHIHEQDSGDSLTLSTEVYSCEASNSEFRATHLANTVQQLNKEVLKLTSNTDCVQCDDVLQSNATTTTKTTEVPNNRKNYHATTKEEFKKITVRRSSADNLSLNQGDQRNASSSTNSEDSSDEYYTKVSWRSNAKDNQDTERLLMSYGENPPRSHVQRKKKLQKVSKHCSGNCRKRSHTFHTDRDLVKPNISEIGPQKFHSFRITRKQIEESVKDRPIDINLIRSLSGSLRKKSSLQSPNNSMQKFENTNLPKTDMNPKTLEHLLLREIASDSKIPLLMHYQHDESNDLTMKNLTHPVRSMSEKHKSETATLKREYIQKKRTKKRLKSPPESALYHTPNEFNSKQKTSKEQLNQQNVTMDSLTDCRSSHSEIPTITIQFPKRKIKKGSRSRDDANASEEHTFTITMPKKRSLSSEHESSSVSESSPRLSHSTEESSKHHFQLPENAGDKDVTETSTDEANGTIRLLKLVSLSKFDTPFSSDGNQMNTPNNSPTEPFPQRKRKADQSSTDNSPLNGTNKIADQFDRVLLQSNSHDFSSNFTSEDDSKGHYVKSPSAPQLDWRKTCAKKSKSGAPNVKTLIEKYNQKVIESQTFRSPYSSNVNSPSTIRKTSAPTQSCQSPLPQTIPSFFSTPTTPVTFESSNNSPIFKHFTSELVSKSPPSSPLAIARAEALRRAKEEFISSQTSLSLPPGLPTECITRLGNDDEMEKLQNEVKYRKAAETDQQRQLQHVAQDDDVASCSSMDSANIVMLRAGANCQELRMPKRNLEPQKSDNQVEEKHNLKPSKSLSNSSLFKSVLSHDFKMPSSLLRLKKSKRKKDMSTVTHLCRQSLLLTCEDTSALPVQSSHKSCPSSPDLKTKNAGKSGWFQKNIFKHK
ncbi:early endosome antigen 1 [Parasteatoda tepidariorum]|uniref:early endosome antigen 1 n=1 Tax=Parasteatoda tepidariorum TaxID=114398 RepID=UPI00077FC672|nr:uncharacterized protein LOC107453200 [Parasteatoda tepidariorum]XP_015925412.1 uncharacterized protein LOC107453200 [Parasteatoda tepidariorum]XP_015925413.1 uncharacterized protein LOC107453200 [Parasteatoda tepidariorum]